MHTIWRVVRESPLLWRAWEGEIVVYNDASGDTDHLDPLAAEIFETLLEAPANNDELTDRIAQALGVEKTTDLRDTVASVVIRFHGHGLIEPVEE
jgi:PqqD family protein of HPr-rel-A system